MAVMRTARLSNAPLLLGLMTVLALAGCGRLGLGGGAAAVDLDTVPRAKIEAFGTPILRATIPARGVDTLLSIRETKGDVVVWESAEGYTFAFRSGVLIETRGLGPDLMSANVPKGAAIAAGTPFTRSYYYVWEDDRNQRRDYACTAESRGAEAITIYSKSYQTRHMAEVCQRDQGRITNDYWFEGQKIRQSRQWISPAAGYAKFVNVTG